jgi:asparagine synthase (glutamine-hydrolysing)
MAHMLLRDTDTMSMANSLEIRVPLIDYTVVEFVAQKIPSYLKRKNGMTKHLLIQSCRDILPDEVIFRKKRGFEFPMRNWLRNELRNVVEDCLSKNSIEKRGIFDYVETERLKKRFYAVHPRVPYLKIWIPVVLELWCREYLDKNELTTSCN